MKSFSRVFILVAFGISSCTSAPKTTPAPEGALGKSVAPKEEPKMIPFLGLKLERGPYVIYGISWRDPGITPEGHSCWGSRAEVTVILKKTGELVDSKEVALGWSRVLMTDGPGKKFYFLFDSLVELDLKTGKLRVRGVHPLDSAAGKYFFRDKQGSVYIGNSSNLVKVGPHSLTPSDTLPRSQVQKVKWEQKWLSVPGAQDFKRLEMQPQTCDFDHR